MRIKMLRVIAWFVDLYVLYLPDQQLPQIKPTFPPIFLVITRCAAIERSLLPAVNLISSVIDVLSRHVPVMGTVVSRTILVRHVRTTSYPVMSRANRQPRSTHWCEQSISTIHFPHDYPIAWSILVGSEAADRFRGTDPWKLLREGTVLENFNAFRVQSRKKSLLDSRLTDR